MSKKQKATMTLEQCEALAKDVGFNSMRFVAFFPVGAKDCTWLDAYFGLFKVDELGDGFLTVRDTSDMFPDLMCAPIAMSEAA